MSKEIIEQNLDEGLEENLETNLKEAIKLIKPENQSNQVIEEIYYNTAKNIGKRLELNNFDELVVKVNELGLGKTRVNLISDEKIIIRLYECLTCSDIGYIGKAICFFEAGIIAGAVSSILDYDIDAAEEECQGLGANYCQFILNKEQKEKQMSDPKSNINMVNLTLHSLNLAKQYKKAEYKTEIFSNTNQKLNEVIKNINQINHYNEQVLDNIPNGLAVIDPNGVITRLNKEYNQILKVPEDQIIDKNVDTVGWQSYYKQVIKENKSSVWKETIHSNEYIIFETPVEDSQGVIRQLIPVESDFIKLLFDKIDFLEKEMKYYKNKAEIQTQESLSPGCPTLNQEMQEIEEYIKKVARTDATILLRGESGTGKTTYARKIHNQSLRKHNPFIYIDCTTIPDNFFEAELFGYEAGAYTGARKDGKVGQLALGDGGSIFLDEVSEIPSEMQAKLLRFIQEQKFKKIGSNQVEEVDVRIIAASNQNLEAMVQAKEFRKDLYYRLNVVNITLPPLRDRWQDIPCLVDNILLHYSKEVGIEPKTISDEGIKAMIDYNWPGNIRELENFLQRLSISADGDIINADDVNAMLKQTWQFQESTAVSNSKNKSSQKNIDQVEKEVIKKKLEKLDNKSQIARELGISRQTLYNKIDKYNL